MTDFEEWFAAQTLEVHTGRSIAYAAFLAGQASAKDELMLRDQQIQRLVAENTELERERDHWKERADILRDELERELEGQKKANGFLALKAQAGEPAAFVDYNHRDGFRWATPLHYQNEKRLADGTPLFTHPTTERSVPEDVRKLMEMALEALEYYDFGNGVPQRAAEALRNALNAAPTPTKGE